MTLPSCAKVIRILRSITRTFHRFLSMLRPFLHLKQVSSLRDLFISTHRLISFKNSPSFIKIVNSSIVICVLTHPFSHGPGHLIALKIKLSLKFFYAEVNILLVLLDISHAHHTLIQFLVENSLLFLVHQRVPNGLRPYHRT